MKVIASLGGIEGKELIRLILVIGIPFIVNQDNLC